MQLTHHQYIYCSQINYSGTSGPVYKFTLSTIPFATSHSNQAVRVFLQGYVYAVTQNLPQEEMSIFNSPKDFWRSLSEQHLWLLILLFILCNCFIDNRSHFLFSFLVSFVKLKQTPPVSIGINALSFCIHMAECHPSGQKISQFIKPKDFKDTKTGNFFR